MKKADKKEGIGDINSTARGSGARYNQGKPKYELLDVDTLARSVITKPYYKQILSTLWTWHHGNTNSDALLQAAVLLTNIHLEEGTIAWEDVSFGGIAWDECAKVFEYGTKKYAAWNWMKGMPWSVPFGCMLRHLKKIYQGELIDPESGCTHLGHFLCNVMMLCYYEHAYVEGDNRPDYSWEKIE